MSLKYEPASEPLHSSTQHQHTVEVTENKHPERQPELLKISPETDVECIVS